MTEYLVGAIVLAAGDGTRMKSQRPKVCCEVLLRPMIDWVLGACEQADIPRQNTCVVLSDCAELVAARLPEGVQRCVQRERLGTGHAVQCAREFLLRANDAQVAEICVLCGDAPFIDSDDLRAALAFHRQQKAAVTVLTAVLAQGGNYGRIVRENGLLQKIVEKKNADAQTLSIQEVNSGAYWFDTAFLCDALLHLVPNERTGEYYLTDLVELAKTSGKQAAAFVCQNPTSVLGANTRKELAQLNTIARNIVLSTHYDNGVDIPVADGVIIAGGVKIGADTRILPNCILTGDTVIGENCIIGPNTTIHNSTIGDDSIIEQSKLTDSKVGCDVRIGPFSQLRPNSVVADKVKIGNFVEVKNSSLGEKTSVAHLTYIGDSDFGKAINVGCGVVTVNYDGVGKYRSTVGDNCFIGCNTNLISPVTIGEGAYIAAASTVTEDILPDALAIGRVRVIQKEKGALKFRKKK